MLGHFVAELMLSPCTLPQRIQQSPVFAQAVHLRQYIFSSQDSTKSEDMRLRTYDVFSKAQGFLRQDTSEDRLDDQANGQYAADTFEDST
jgi:hypothetical protein